MAELESVMVVGDGGREAALLKEVLDSGVLHVYSTRGEDAVDIGLEGVVNTGMGNDIEAIGSFASQERLGLVVVGPEAPLVHGVGDVLRARGIPVFGPNANGARFEADKTFTHAFAERHGLPNPDNSRTFSPAQREEARAYITELGAANVYTKRVGLEGGKGAVGYQEDELEKALAEADAIADKGEDLLVQGRLHGPEYSATFLLDGKGGVVATALARDHKSLYEWGKGPNTGGMGAWAPLTFKHATQARRQEIEHIGIATAQGLLEDGIDYRGVIYAGLMAETQDHDSPLKLLEFNVRFGDPETQVLLQSLGGSALDYMVAAAHGSGETDMSRLYLDSAKSLLSLTVCLASPGYAQEDQQVVTGLPIHVPEDLPEDISIQFAGAKMVDGVPHSKGGRVLYVTKSNAPNTEAAREVYDYIGRDTGGVYIGDDQQVIRKDIGLV